MKLELDATVSSLKSLSNTGATNLPGKQGTKETLGFPLSHFGSGSVYIFIEGRLNTKEDFCPCLQIEKTQLCHVSPELNYKLRRVFIKILVTKWGDKLAEPGLRKPRKLALRHFGHDSILTCKLVLCRSLI